MQKLGGIVGGLKFVLKYAVYIMALIKIVEFAITTIDEVDNKQPQKETKSLSNE